MVIILDFDYTLFDTHCLRAQLLNALQPFGVTAKQYHAAEAQVKQAGLYTIEQHLAVLLQDEHRSHAQHAVEEQLSDMRNCVYTDVLPFIERAKQHQVTLILLSFGHPEWQRTKIKAAHIGQYMDQIIVTDQPKEQVVSQLNTETHADILVVNDRGSELDAIKRALPQSTAVWMQRPHTPYVKEPCDSSDFRVNNFSSVTSHI